MALTKLISVDDFRKLLDKVESERDRIAIKLLFGTGCRVEELVGTKLEDVDTVEGVIHIHAARTKTRQYRDVIVPKSIIPELEGWIGSLPEGSATAPKPFCRLASSMDLSPVPAKILKLLQAVPLVTPFIVGLRGGGDPGSFGDRLSFLIADMRTSHTNDTHYEHKDTISKNPSCIKVMLATVYKRKRGSY